MPSQEHEAIADLFRERPDVIVTLLRAAGVALDDGVRARPVDSSFAGFASDYHGDTAVVVEHADGRPQLAVVVEVQLARDRRKRLSWPVYETLARARHRVPACVLVFTRDPRVARWVAQPVDLGPSGSRFAAITIGPSAIPRIVDEQQARAIPELAVLSALAHGNEATGGLDALIAAMAAIVRLPDDRHKLYFDLVYAALNNATRTELEALMNLKNYQYKSEFARQCVAEGKAEGVAEGRAAAVIEVMSARGIAVSDEQRAHVLACRDSARIDRWLRRAAVAARMSDVLED